MPTSVVTPEDLAADRDRTRDQIMEIERNIQREVAHAMIELERRLDEIEAAVRFLQGQEIIGCTDTMSAIPLSEDAKEVTYLGKIIRVTK